MPKRKPTDHRLPLDRQYGHRPDWDAPRVKSKGGIFKQPEEVIGTDSQREWDWHEKIIPEELNMRVPYPKNKKGST